MSDSGTNTPIQEGEISLRELILKTKEYFFDWLKSWKLVLLICIPFIAYFVYQAKTTPLTFPAGLTFMINEDDSGLGGGTMAVLNQFGLGRRAQGAINLDKIIELSKSRKIIHKVLFEKTERNENIDFVANHLIEVYNYKEQWEESSLENFKFTHDSLLAFTRVENIALKNLYNRIIGTDEIEALLYTNIDDDTGILKLSISSVSEQLSLDMVNLLFENLSSYYINKTVEKQRVTYNIVKAKTDSLKAALNAAEYKLARHKDSNRGLWTKTAELKEQQYLRDIQVLNIMYGESLKNLEVSDFALKNKTPFIQVIDYPFLPLGRNKSSVLMAIIKGLFIGIFLATVFIVLRKVIRDALETD